MGTVYCPRCSRPLSSSSRIHLACVLGRARVLVGAGLGTIVALVLIAIVIASARPH